MKKLVAKEFVTDVARTIKVPAGHRYSYFIDPETGKYYEPVDGFTVTTVDGDLSDRFVEVQEIKEEA